jgi:hypothetical protein
MKLLLQKIVSIGSFVLFLTNGTYAQTSETVERDADYSYIEASVLPENMEHISGAGGAGHLAKYIRSFVLMGALPKIREQVLESNEGKIVLIPVHRNDEEIRKENLRLRRSGFDFIQFQPTTKPTEPALSSAYIGWMIARGLTIPTVSFITAFLVGVYESKITQNSMMMAGIQRPESDIFTPYIAAGVALATVNFFAEVGNEPWKPLGSNRVGPVVRFATDFLSSALVLLVGSAAASRPWERGWQSVYFPDSVVAVSLAAAVTKTITYGTSRSILLSQARAGELHPTYRYALDGILRTYMQVAIATLLIGRSVVLPASLASIYFLAVSAPLLAKTYIGDQLYDRYTAWKGSPQEYPMSKRARVCARVLGGLSSLYTFPKAFVR